MSLKACIYALGMTIESMEFPGKLAFVILKYGIT